MNKYLLLRDNKQSGPFTINDLATHGFKPYDLVWLEGKSAAWRYPSEIQELKSFAPIVEEQPFDRFYKKSEPVNIEPTVQDSASIHQVPVSSVKEELKPLKQEKNSSKEKEWEVINATKKIHVSLPGFKTAQPIAVTKYVEKEKQSVFIPTVSTNKSFTNSPGVSIDEHPKTILSGIKSKPVISEDHFAEKNNSKQPNSKYSMNGNGKAPVSKLLLRGIAAACLLLGGAFIGLFINYNSQQKKLQHLNQLVQQIQERDNVNSSLVEKNKAIVPETNTQNIPEDIDPPSPEEPVYKEDIRLPAIKKSAAESKIDRKANSNNSLEESVTESNALPVVIKQQEPPLKSERSSTELARKNLWQLVSVNHNQYKTGVLGGISNLELKLVNKSLYQLEQVEIEVKYFNAEKKVVNQQTVFFENVSPGELLLLQVPKSKRGVKIDYAIKKISTKELGLAHIEM